MDGLRTGWSDKRDELGIAVTDGIATLLFRHDMVEPLLRGREQRLDFDGLMHLGRDLPLERPGL